MKEQVKEIKGLINEDALLKSIEVNNDSYGGACVQVAINVMKHLDTFEGEFNIGYSPDMTTTHGIICHCDDQGGISGFMAGAARNLVAHCHKLGWKFFLADCINQYEVDSKSTRKKVVDNIVEAGLVEKKEADKYVSELIERFKSCKEN